MRSDAHYEGIGLRDAMLKWEWYYWEHGLFMMKINFRQSVCGMGFPPRCVWNRLGRYKDLKLRLRADFGLRADFETDTYARKYFSFL